jgi:YXWGXW repeat-containing protein
MRILGGLFLGVVVLGAGCYHDYSYDQPVSARPFTVAVAPPPPIEEQPPPEPYLGSVWMAGFWDWRGDLGRHVWVAGHWATAPRVGVVYMPPSWQPDGHGRYYRADGRWVAGVGRDAYGRHLAYDSLGRPHYF